MALKWRQKTVTFVRYDYVCSLVSLLSLSRNFNGSLPLSFAGSEQLLLFIWTFCPLSLDTSLPGCWFYFCPSPLAIHSAYCVRTDSQIWNTCFPHTVKCLTLERRNILCGLVNYWEGKVTCRCSWKTAVISLSLCCLDWLFVYLVTL